MDLLLTFLKQPLYFKKTAIDWSDFFKLYFILVIIIIVLSPVITLLKIWLDIKEENLNLSDFIVFIGMVVIAPITEEIIFRLILRPTYTNIILFSLFAFLGFAFSIYKHNVPMMISSFFIAGIFALILSGRKKIVKTQFIIIRHYKLFFYFSCILFGLVHVFNNGHVTVGILLAAPILVLPQFICGGFLGFVRIKYGLIYSILFHSLINLIPAIFMLMSVAKA